LKPVYVYFPCQLSILSEESVGYSDIFNNVQFFLSLYRSLQTQKLCLTMLWTTRWSYRQDLLWTLLTIRLFGGFMKSEPQLIMVKQYLYFGHSSSHLCGYFCYNIKLTLKCCAVHVKVASSLLEMWYNYHTSLWTYCSGSPKVFLLDFTYSSKNILLQP
jgi:hypothetical protein